MKRKKELFLDSKEKMTKKKLFFFKEILLKFFYFWEKYKKAGVNVRPYCHEILEDLHGLFEIVVFTASHSSYANTVIDYIDPENKYIKHRFFREHCA